jgi:hypothetical protein
MRTRRTPTLTRICKLTRITVGGGALAQLHTSGGYILTEHIQAYLSLGLNFGVKLVEVNLPQLAHLFQN